MGKKKLRLRRPLSVLAILSTILLVPFLFNSCGEGPQQSLAHNADLEKLRIEAQFSGVYSLDSTLCSSSYNYVCEHHIYSPEIPKSQKIHEFECVDTSSGKLCVQGYKMGHNSDSAVKNCQDKVCEDSYIYQEYRCYNSKVLYEGVYILDVTAASLEEAVSSVHTQCRELKGE